MVLESMIRSPFALKHPLALFFFGIVITGLSMGISTTTFPDYASILTIAFITIGTMPILYHIFRHEEKTEMLHPASPFTFFGRHFHLIEVYGFLFLGIITAYAIGYTVLPTDLHENVYREQLSNVQRINDLRGAATENALRTACNSQDLVTLTFNCIFLNNAIVLAWSLLLAFFYGAGAIFLIAWNASVIGVVVGKEAAQFGWGSGILKVVGLLPHGTPEVLAYFIGAIAGGMISISVARKTYLKKEFTTIGKDIFVMVALAYFLLVIAAVLEAALILNP